MSTLPAATPINQVTLKTRRLANLSVFYQKIIGLKEISSTDDTAYLSANGQEPAQLVLIQDETALPLNRRQPGLYHVAWLVPNRLELARVLHHLQQTNWPLQGFGDHLVSEAIYLADADGNGIEIYADRPRDTWPIVNNQVQMDTVPVDVPGLLAQITPDTPDWSGLHPETIIGHIHLQVSSLKQAKHFYNGLLGFDVMQENYPGALFVSAGGYHHHIGLNTWHSQNAAPRAGNQSGLADFTILLPNEISFRTLQDRLSAENISVIEKAPNTFLVQDPDHLQILWQYRLS